MVTVGREPRIHPVLIEDLRPTQITVGMREVEAKRQHWQIVKDQKKADHLGSHMIPVVKGPKNRFYVVDHHHLSLALLLEGETMVAITVTSDLSRLDKDAFWVFMDNRGWMHPFDDESRRCPYADIPKSVRDLVDDPFRSLAGELRQAGGFAKDTTPFSEFLWADFLRRHLKRKDVEANFASALKEALGLAKSGVADHLPGWCGPTQDGLTTNPT
jgi:hypothetical protein